MKRLVCEIENVDDEDKLEELPCCKDDSNVESLPCCNEDDVVENIPCCVDENVNENDLPCCLEENIQQIDNQEVQTCGPCDCDVNMNEWVGDIAAKDVRITVEGLEPPVVEPVKTCVSADSYKEYKKMTPGVILANSANAKNMWPVNGYHGTWHVTRSTMASSQVTNGRQRQDPDGIFWIRPANWVKAEWDCVPIDHCKFTRAETIKWMFPDPNTMRGLRERFYQVNPFKDVRNPTVEEIDSWNVEVINHFRRLMGFANMVKPSRALFLRTQWGNEAYAIQRFVKTRTYEKEDKTIVTERYVDSKGVCPFGQTNSHCDAEYLPACGLLDTPGTQPGQSHPAYRYTDEDEPRCLKKAGNQSEGIITVNADLPWSIKLSRVILSFISSDGFCFHTGPFLKREFVGMAWLFVPNAKPANILRIKWAGQEVMNKICCK